MSENVIYENKKVYVKPIIETRVFESEDVITTSSLQNADISGNSANWDSNWFGN